MLVSVSVSGVRYDRALIMPVGWNASVRVKNVSGAYGDCPAGRYCPAGTGEPVVCPAGFYSSQTKRVTVCPFKCYMNNYCPDPGKLVPCPPNTHSAIGGTSQLDCKCDPGFQCVYRRQVNLNLVLNVPYKAWVGPAGEALRAALMQAVAESAGVSPGSVKIEQVLPSVSGGVGGGGRRLLWGGKVRAKAGREDAALVSLSVAGAEKVEGLQERLRKREEFRAGARVHWRRVENLKVLPAPPKSENWWTWRAKRH